MTSTGGHPDVVVVGAGIVGSACAAALARDRLRVTLVDTGFVGSGTTSVGMGHIVALDDSSLELTLCTYSRRLWTEMADRLPADCEDERRGTLWIATSDAEMAVARKRRDAYARHGVDAMVLDERELAAQEPALRPGLAGALFVPDDRVLYPPAAAKYFAEQARSSGATVLEGTTALAVGKGELTLRGPSGSTTTLSTAAVVNAAGVDAPRLTPGLPVIPRKGHLVITDRHPDVPCRSELVELGYVQSAHNLGGASTAFNLQPRATGQLLIGSSREMVGRTPGINRLLLRAMLERALEFVPALASCAAVRTWTGFRPATPDNLPLIGRWEPMDGVWIAAGHEGLGITLAPITAELIAAAIGGRTPPIDPTPFSPARPMPSMDMAGAH